jgi:pyrimidine-nucleoside phosphorylase
MSFFDSSFNLHHNKISELEMEEICSVVKNSPINENQIAELTMILAHSGDKLNFSDYNTADIPSTGGPSSLSTIISPLILKEYFAVPKLGIVGRPAGGIDVLAQIEGYNLNLSKKEIYEIIDKTQYCHFISNNQFAPLDSKLFKYRSEKKFKNVPGLVIASLLSKKVAVDIKNICLDIRYSQFGNFGSYLDEAKKFSDNFKHVSNLLGINSKFYFSDNSRLFQPYIGRGESLLAIYEYLSDCKNNWLNHHIEIECMEMVSTLTNEKIESSELKSVIIKNFLENIETQGGNIGSYENVVKKIKNLHIYEFSANKSGILTIDIMKMRDTIVKIQNKYLERCEKFPDPCGLIFLKNQKENISKNETILTFRVFEDDLEYFKNELNNFISIN